MNTFVIHNALPGFYHVEFDSEGSVAHVSGVLPTLTAAIGQAVAAGATAQQMPLEYVSHPHYQGG